MFKMVMTGKPIQNLAVYELQALKENRVHCAYWIKMDYRKIKGKYVAQ